MWSTQPIFLVAMSMFPIRLSVFWTIKKLNIGGGCWAWAEFGKTFLSEFMTNINTYSQKWQPFYR